MIAAADRYDAVPSSPSGTGVLLLAGSSGRIEEKRADLLAARGARVRAIRWFGGEGQRPAAHEVPLEIFVSALDELRAESERVALFGTSFGAEAALSVAAVTSVDATVAVAPSSVVWAGWWDGAWSSHWTLGRRALPAVAFDPTWHAESNPPAYRSLYERSLRLDLAATAAARIPVEQIEGDLLLVAGGDDQVWPSVEFADEIVASRTASALTTTVVTHPDAGHRLVLPGEEPVTGGVRMRRGGSLEADSALGARAWPEIRRVLRLN